MRDKRFQLAALAVLVLCAAAAGARGPKGDRSWLGVSLQESSDGVEIVEVHDGSPAEEAGLLRGDIVLEIDGESITNTSVLVDAVRAQHPGQSVRLKLRRDSRELEQLVTLGTKSARLPRRLNELYFLDGDRRPFGDLDFDFDFDVDPHAKAFSFQLGCLGGPRLGVSTQPLTTGLADYFGVEAGVLVSDVVPDSAADSAGLQPGDVIVAINDELIRGHHELVQSLREGDSESPTRVRINRRGAELTLDAMLEPRPDPERCSGVGPLGFHVKGLQEEDLKELKESLSGATDEARKALEELRRELGSAERPGSRSPSRSRGNEL